MTTCFLLYVPKINWTGDDRPTRKSTRLSLNYFGRECSSSWDVLQLVNDCLMQCGKFTVVRVGPEEKCIGDAYLESFIPEEEIFIDWNKMSGMEELELFAVQLWEKAMEVLSETFEDDEL